MEGPVNIRGSSLSCCLVLVVALTAVSALAVSGQTDREIENSLLAEIKQAEAGSASTLSIALDNIASFYKTKGKFAEALKYYERSLEARKKLFGANDPKVAAALNNIGALYELQKKYDNAETVYQHAIEILDKLRNPEGPEMTTSLHRMVAVYKAKGELEKAERLRAQIPIYYEITGTVSSGRYTSIHQDYVVRIPNLLKPGAKARDEESDSVLSQVIFTDDLGSFYRIISLDNAKGEFSPARIIAMYPKARDKQTVRTSRGEELRFGDIDKEGAELTVTTWQKSADGKVKLETKKPDLATANAAFEANGRIYHVVAGVTLMDPMTPDRGITLAKERLEKLLAEMVVVSKPK